MDAEYHHLSGDHNLSRPPFPLNVSGVEVNVEAGSGSCQGLDCYPDSAFHAITAVTTILAVFGFLGNALTVLAILTSSLRQNLNSILIGHLSFADVLYTSLVLPLQAVAFHHRQWVLPDWVCVVAAAVRIWLIGVIMMLLSVIALYRFLNIVHPQVYTRLSQRNSFLPIVIVCWIFSAFFSTMPILGVWGSFSFEPLILQCTFTSEVADKSHKVVSITLGYVIPCVFICFCYARIGCVVARTRRRATRNSIYRKQKNQRDSLRLTGMMLLIFVGFFLGTTPYFIINIVDPRETLPMAHIWAPCATWLLYSLNPVIYTLMDNNFLRAYKQLVCCLLCSEGDTTRRSFRSRQPQGSSLK
nr:hypothetical protein BaRGS_034811 [Batillaria attramentaria]